jgi:hypothetical protein
MSVRHFVVGGNGRRSGLAATREGSVELRILVLPKLWKDRINAKGESDATRDEGIAASDTPIPFSRSITIVAREGQKFAVRIATEENRFRTAIDNCFTQLVDTGAKIARVRADAEERLQDEDGDDDAAYTRRLPLINELSSAKPSKTTSLITLRPAKSTSKDCEPDVFIDIVPRDCKSATAHRVTRADFAANWKAFQALWLHASDVRNISTATFNQLGQMSASDVASLDLRLLVHIAFVNKVSELLHHARPGYMRVTKPSTFIRGRMNPVSAAVVLAGGATTVECTYDEFGLDTPLHRVIVTALEEVCDSHQSDGWVSLAEGPIGDAAWFRRQLESVQALPRIAALRIGVGLQAQMSKLDGDWAGALDLACLVLDDRSLTPAPGGRSTALSWGRDDDKAFLFDISTESMWEHLVRKYFDCKRPMGRHSWEDLGKTKAPDGAIDGTKIIFDAKYKERPKTPAPGDTHQAFVYSHLFDSKEVLLVYPVRDGKEETSEDGIHWYERNGGECRLASIRLAFPQAGDVLAPVQWRAFIEGRTICINKLKSLMSSTGSP